MRDKYEKPQMNADERRFVERVSAIKHLLLWVLENFRSGINNNFGIARCLPPARALAICMVVGLILVSLDGTGASAPLLSNSGGGSWQYYKEITIKENSGSTLTDYQVLVDLSNFPAKARSDGDDIRFTDAKDIELSYWIESWYTSVKSGEGAMIWVKVPSIPANSETKIKMYYGNPSAIAASQPKQTMLIYEDMQTQPSGYLAGTAIYDPDNKQIKLTSAAQMQTGYLYYLLNPGDGFLARFEFWSGGGNGADALWLGAYDSTYLVTEDQVAGGYHFTFDEYQDRVAFTKNTIGNGNPISSSWTNTIDNSKWHRAVIYHFGKTAKIYYDETLMVDAVDTAKIDKSGNYFIFGGRTGGNYNVHGIRNIIVSKYVSPEPILTIGTEQIYDTAIPSISLIYPSNGQTLSTDKLTVSGTASDNVGLSTVEVRVNSGSWQFASGTTSWSKQITLTSGSNTIYARATDSSGNGAETSVGVVYSPPTPVPTPTTGSISITSSPSSASIYLDGVYKGTTPKLLTDIPQGSHQIKLTLAGYNEWSYTTLVSAGGSTKQSAELKITTLTSNSTKTPAIQTPSVTTPPFPPTSIENPIVLLGVAIIAIFLILASLRMLIPKENTTRATEEPKPVATPSKEPDRKSQAVLIEKSKEPLIENPIEAGTINVKSAYEYRGAKIYFKIKIENNAIEPVGDIKVHLFVPDVFILAEKEKAISMLETQESKTVTFEIRPTGECGECNVSGKIEYYDYATKGRKMLDIENKSLSVICPVLKRKEIDMQQWEKVTDELIKAEENIKELSIPAENLFNIISRVIKDNSMFMLKPEITSTPQLFNGIAMFYAEGVTGLRYAAYIEVVGGARKSRLILKVWAEKEEALTGFYHRILDDIEKRTDIKIFIDDSILQQNIHIGDRIGTQVKDSIVQHSTIGAGARKCHDCGREVEANATFCPECGGRDYE